MKLIRRLAWVTVAFTYFMVLSGSMSNPGTFLLQGHRSLVAITGLLLLTLLALVLRGANQQRTLLLPALMAPVLLIVEIMLETLSAQQSLPGPFAAAQLASALLIFALTLTIAIMASPFQSLQEQAEKTRRFIRLSVMNTFLVYGLVLTGSYVVNTGATLACPSWPLCGNAPAWAVALRLNDINMFHRYVAIFVGLVLVWTLFSAWNRRRVAPGQARLALVAGLLFIVQTSVGALVVQNQALWLTTLHLGLTTAVWGCLVGMTALATRQLNTATEAQEEILEETALPAVAETRMTRFKQTLSSYVDLMKPHVTVLLLGTTVAAMAIADQGLPPLGLVLATLLGGAMAAGSANCINCYIDRDIDGIMGRTQRRSLPSGRVQPTQALIFGVILGIGSFVILTSFVNLLSAILACSAILFYVFVYTLGLKRTTAQNIVIGGAAGAVPVLVGWAAVTNSITLPAIWLFAIIFYWTPPHFWALSLLIQKDYEKAKVPMLPVVMGEQETRKQIFLYSLLLLAVTLVLFVTHTMGYVYLASAVVLGGILIYMAIRLLRDQSKHWARTLFWYSNCYLAAIFAAMVIDRVIH